MASQPGQIGQKTSPFEIKYLYRTPPFYQCTPGQILTLDESLQETIPPLLSLLDALPDDSPFLQLDPPQRRQRTLEGLKRVLLRESQVQPLLLVFEDLHWIDSETQALLDGLVESLPTAQLLLLVNYRPEYQHSWGSKTYYTQLRLDPLQAGSADEFLQALLGNDPSLEPLKKLLIERTEGNPFFLEESVRTLVETQVLVGESGAYRLTQEIPTIHMPATVQAILAARIDRLPQEEKRLLQTAAVIGTEVPFSLLQAITDSSEDALHRGLTHLQAAEFLYETSLFPECVYTFKHALTHEVSYGSLLQERRRTLHARIVEALEALAGNRIDDQVERLAYHALRGEVWEKAFIYFRQAGSKAMEHSALREAVVCFEQALTALERLPEARDTITQAIDLRLDLSNVLFLLRDQTRMGEHLYQAERFAITLGDQQRLGWVSAHMTTHLTMKSELANAIAAGERAHAMAMASKDVTLEYEANWRVGMPYVLRGDFGQAQNVLKRNITVLEGELRHRRFDPAFFSTLRSRFWLIRCLAETGAFAEASAYADESLRIAASIDHHPNFLSACYSVGFCAVRQGDFTRAIAVLEGELERCYMAVPLYVLFFSRTLGVAYMLSGRIADSLSLLEQAVQEHGLFGITDSSLTLSRLGEAYLQASRIDEARDCARRALEHAGNYKERGGEVYARRLLGDIFMHHVPPDIDQAETHYQQALALANELGMRPLQAHCHRGLGTLYRQTGQVEQARVELSTAIELYRDMEMTFWLPETEAALAQVERR